MISLRDVVTGFGNRDPLAEVWRRDLRGGGSSAEITGTLPLSFSGRGKPLTDYLISGNTVQDGTPTPEAPAEVKGVGVKTSNLVDWNSFINSIDSIHGGGTYTATSTSISITSGTNTDAYTSPYNAGNTATYRLEAKPNTKYSVSIEGSGGYQLILWKNGIAGSGYGLYLNSARKFVTIETDSTTTFFTLRAANTGSLGSTATISNVMMIEGEYTEQTMPTYEPYGYKLPLTVNGTEYPIYLGQVESTRRIKKVVFDGTEIGWGKNIGLTNSNAFTISMPNWVGNRKIGYCTHYRNVTDAQATEGIFFGNSLNILTAFADGLDDATKFKSYLAAQYAAGTPVTIWYVLAKPETGIVNEPLHKIGDYADTISFAQAGMTIPTASGTNVLDMTSPVNPSEVYIKGKGIKPTNDPNFENGG